MDGELQMQRYKLRGPGSVPRPLAAGVGMKTVVDVRIESEGIRIRFPSPLRTIVQDANLFSRTLPEGENWIKHRNRNTTS
jgi:hypothetical protein